METMNLASGGSINSHCHGDNEPSVRGSINSHCHGDNEPSVRGSINSHCHGDNEPSVRGSINSHCHGDNEPSVRGSISSCVYCEVVPSGIRVQLMAQQLPTLTRKVRLASNPGPFLHTVRENEPVSFPGFPIVQFLIA